MSSNEEPLLRGLEGLRGAGEGGGDGRRAGSGRAAFCTRSTASPSATPGSRLKESVTAGSWPEWSTVSGPMAGVSLASDAERHERRRCCSRT